MFDVFRFKLAEKSTIVAKLFQYPSKASEVTPVFYSRLLQNICMFLFITKTYTFRYPAIAMQSALWNEVWNQFQRRTQSLTFPKTKSFREILCVLKYRRCLTNDVHEMYNLICSLFAMKIYQRTLEIFMILFSAAIKNVEKAISPWLWHRRARKCDKLMAKWWQTWE